MGRLLEPGAPGGSKVVGFGNDKIKPLPKQFEARTVFSLYRQGHHG